MMIWQERCSLLLQVPSSSSWTLFFCADRVTAVLCTRAWRCSQMCSFAESEVNMQEGWCWLGLGPGWGREGGNPTAVQRQRAPCLERGTDVRHGGLVWKQDQGRRQAGSTRRSRRRQIWEYPHQIIPPAEPRVQQTQGFLLCSNCLLSANTWGSCWHRLWVISACSLSRGCWAISIPSYSAFQAWWN